MFVRWLWNCNFIGSCEVTYSILVKSCFFCWRHCIFQNDFLMFYLCLTVISSCNFYIPKCAFNSPGWLTIAAAENDFSKRQLNEAEQHFTHESFCMWLACQQSVPESLSADSCQNPFHICEEFEECWLTTMWENSLVLDFKVTAR